MTEPTREVLSMVEQLVDLEKRYDEAYKLSTKLYWERTNLREQLNQKMEELGLENFRTSEFGLISRKTKLWASITDLSLAEAWFTEQGIQDELLKKEAVSGRLNELVRERLEKGLAIPPGVDYSLKRTISIHST